MQFFWKTRKKNVLTNQGGHLGFLMTPKETTHLEDT
jgi:predicted alpha/beta-fold hydrolase